MPVHEPSHPIESQTILEDRECPGCKYNLKGLRRGGKCPECGRSIGGKPRGRLMTDITSAPPSYLKTVRIGLAIMCLSVVAACVPVIGAGGFAAGVWIALIKRPLKDGTAPDWLLDTSIVRTAGRYLMLAPIAGSVLAYAAIMLGGPGGVVVGVLAGMFFVAGAVGFVPLCAYLSALADWASYDALAGRFRSTTWLVAVGGVVTSVLWAIPATRFFSIWAGFALFAAMVLFLLGIFQLANAVSWAIKNQSHAEGSAARVAEARAKREKEPNKVHDLRCRRCGYDLEGLPLGGACPECNESYADATGLPVREPPKRRPEDEAPIPVEEGVPESPKQIRHARHLSERDADPAPKSPSGGEAMKGIDFDEDEPGGALPLA